MATTEEKTELVETLKGPRFYSIRLYGYDRNQWFIYTMTSILAPLQSIVNHFKHGRTTLIHCNPLLGPAAMVRIMRVRF